MLSDIPTLLDDISAGRMVILMDDEDRENEGDLIIAAEKATPEIINFFATEACGLICMPITPERARQLNLPLMVRDNRSQHETNFTVSIDATEQVGPGIQRRAARAYDPAGGSEQRHAERHPSAGAYIPTRGETRRRTEARRSIPKPASIWRGWRAYHGSGDCRNHEPRRHHGAAAGARGFCQRTWPQHGHHRRSDRVPLTA